MQGFALKNLFVLVCVCVISAAVGYVVFSYGNASVVSAMAFGGAVFSVLMVLHNNLMAARHFSQSRRELHDIYSAQDELLNATRSEQTTGVNVTPGRDVKTNEETSLSASQPSVLAGLAQDSDSKTATTNEPNLTLAASNNQAPSKPEPRSDEISDQGDNNPSEDNVVVLPRSVTPSPNQEEAAGKQFKPSQLKKALKNGQLELYLQPVLEIPSKAIRYFEALVRLRIDEHLLTPAQFFPAARDGGLVGHIDLVSLQHTVKLVRGLQRQENEYPVFWNLCAQSLANGKIFDELISILRANQTLNKMLICEISQHDYARLNRVQSGNIDKICDLGFELSLDNAEPGELLDQLITSERFCAIKVPAEALMRFSSRGSMPLHSHLAGLLDGGNTKLIASTVERDSQTMALIEADIDLAMGNGLVAARPLKKDVGARA